MQLDRLDLKNAKRKAQSVEQALNTALALNNDCFALCALRFTLFTALRPTPGSADLCFLAAIPMDAVLTHLAAAGVAIEEGPVARSGALGPICSVYLRDPDGNLLEIAVDEGPA